MRQVCALLMVFMFFSASVAPAIAGGSAYRSSQARARKAHKVWEQRMDEFWKKFDSDMALTGAQPDNPKRRSPKPQSNERQR